MVLRFTKCGMRIFVQDQPMLLEGIFSFFNRKLDTLTRTYTEHMLPWKGMPYPASYFILNYSTRVK